MLGEMLVKLQESAEPYLRFPIPLKQIFGGNTAHLSHIVVSNDVRAMRSWHPSALIDQHMSREERDVRKSSD